MNRSLSSSIKAAVQIVFVLSVLLSAQAQAQSLVGNWAVQGAPLLIVGFQSNGRWSFSDTDPADTAQCGGSAITAGGSYSASGSALSMSADSAGCGTSIYSGASIPIGSGSYTISGNTLTVALSSTSGPLNLVLTALGARTVTPTTPLPPPPTTQAVFTAPAGKMPAAAVSVDTKNSTFGSAALAVTLDLSKLAGGSFAGLGQFAAGYNIYVGALVPKGALGLTSPTWFVLPQNGSWAPMGSPIAAYMQGLAQNATDKVVISILSGLNVTGLVGAEIYIGYGTSDTEMLAAGRYRGVYIVQ